MNNQTIEEFESLANLFFDRARSIQDTSREKFRAEYKSTKSRIKQVFPLSKWRELQDKWALAKIKAELEEVYISVTAREKFTIKLIIKRLRSMGIGQVRFMRLAGDVWSKHRMQLPTRRELVLRIIEEQVAKRIPSRDLTMELIFKIAGVKLREEAWLHVAILSARQELLKHQIGNKFAQPPEGVRTLTLPGGWIDIDADIWDLRSGGGRRLNRTLLRSDIADIAWSQMREALLSEHLTCETVGVHYRGYLLAGELLGTEIPDVHEATLQQVQRAWVMYAGKANKLMNIRSALKRIFSQLCMPAMEESGVNVKEMLLISAWLYTSAVVRLGSPKQGFLSEAELNDIIAGCMSDIKAGLDFTESEPDLLGLSTRPRSDDNAAVVVQWAGSLMILLMLFTGLRVQSVVNLKIDDWDEIRPGLFAIIWSHGKKREEKVAILPVSVALLLNQYVKRTAKVRQVLETKKVFLTSNLNSYWSATQSVEYARQCLLPAFARRHSLKRGGMLHKLNCTMLRRTYVTRELYMGRSIWALQLQLGHESLRTTRQYGKFDLFEHPAEVGVALDEYGRESLSLWHYPLLISDLDTTERDRLLGVKEERHQDVGLCRYDCCCKDLNGNPPPCSLCEHLVTGPEFVGAWDIERKFREREIERLQSTDNAEHLLAQEKSQYEMFLVNITFVKGEKHL